MKRKYINFSVKNFKNKDYWRQKQLTQNQQGSKIDIDRNV